MVVCRSARVVAVVVIGAVVVDFDGLRFIKDMLCRICVIEHQISYLPLRCLDSFTNSLCPFALDRRHVFRRIHLTLDETHDQQECLFRRTS